MNYNFIWLIHYYFDFAKSNSIMDIDKNKYINCEEDENGARTGFSQKKWIRNSSYG